MTSARSIERALARVDHLVFAAPELAAGIATVEELLGVRATAGGQHPNRGTRNALISLGARIYIEIIGADPDQPTPAEPRPFRIDELAAPQLVAWSAHEPDLEGLSLRAAVGGVRLGSIGGGSRTRPDGLLLTWRYTDPRAMVSDGVVPFFIDWGLTPHPAASATYGGDLVGFRAVHPNAAGVREELKALGLEFQVDPGPAPALIATIDGSRGSVELR
jgi:hypothetical protein